MGIFNVTKSLSNSEIKNLIDKFPANQKDKKYLLERLINGTLKKDLLFEGREQKKHIKELEKYFSDFVKTKSAGDNMKFLKGYKKLYEIEKEKNYVFKKENDDLRAKEEKEISLFSVKVYFDVEDERYILFENVVEYKTNYVPYSIGSTSVPENWIIKTADGLTSVIDYKKVECIVVVPEAGD